MGRLVESNSKGNANILYIGDNAKLRVRFLLDGTIKKADGATVIGTQMPLGSWWHRIADKADIGRKFHNWLCIGKYRNCPLCAENGQWEATQPPGQKIANKDRPYPLTKKTYVNAFIYDEGRVKVVPLGNDLWDQLQLLEKTLAIDIDKMDVVLTRTGQGLQTTYGAIQLGASPFVMPEGQFLLDLEEQVATSDRGQEDLNQILSGEFDRKFAAGNTTAAGQGGPVDAGAAGAMMVNFGHYAGKTLSEIVKVDVKYVQWLAVNSNDPNVAQAAAAVIQAVVPSGAVNGPPAAPAVSSLPPVAPPVQAPPPPPPPPPAPVPASAVAPPPAAPAPNPFAAIPPAAPAAQVAAPAVRTLESVRSECIAKASANPAYKDYRVLMAKMQQAGGGNDINTFTMPQLEQLLAIL